MKTTFAFPDPTHGGLVCNGCAFDGEHCHNTKGCFCVQCYVIWAEEALRPKSRLECWLREKLAAFKGWVRS